MKIVISYSTLIQRVKEDRVTKYMKNNFLRLFNNSNILRKKINHSSFFVDNIRENYVQIIIIFYSLDKNSIQHFQKGNDKK